MLLNKLGMQTAWPEQSQLLAEASVGEALVLVNSAYAYASSDAQDSALMLKSPCSWDNPPDRSKGFCEACALQI